MHARLVVDALNMAAWTRRGDDLDGADLPQRCGQYTSIAYSRSRDVNIGLTASTV